MSFWNTLFNSGEGICISQDQYGTSLYPNPHRMNQGYSWQYFSINPLHTSRKDANVTAYRNLLFEIDDADWSTDRQLEFVLKEKVCPVTAATYSGGKSVHFIISLSEPCKDRSEYRALWQRIWKALDGRPDKSTSNPSRFSRTPGAIRVGTEREQRLLHLAGRVDRVTLERWLREQGADEVTAERVERERAPAGMKGILTKWTERFIALGAARGEWNAQLFKSSCDAFRNNYELEEWQELLEHSLHVELDSADLKTIQSAHTTVSLED